MWKWSLLDAHQLSKNSLHFVSLVVDHFVPFPPSLRPSLDVSPPALAMVLAFVVVAVLLLAFVWAAVAHCAAKATNTVIGSLWLDEGRTPVTAVVMSEVNVVDLLPMMFQAEDVVVDLLVAPSWSALPSSSHDMELVRQWIVQMQPDQRPGNVSVGFAVHFAVEVVWSQFSMLADDCVGVSPPFSHSAFPVGPFVDPSLPFAAAIPVVAFDATSPWFPLLFVV